jgi:hypothetical protein
MGGEAPTLGCPNQPRRLLASMRYVLGLLILVVCLGGCALPDTGDAKTPDHILSPRG